MNHSRPLSENILLNALEKATQAAQHFLGATSPNPAVGAIALDQKGEILSLKAHEKAGLPHAEAKVIADLEKQGRIADIHTLVVTLEPCNHVGKTPACTQAILKAKIKRVVYAEADPNPKVLGRGAQFLRDHGVEVSNLSTEKTQELIQAFSHFVKTGLPWVTLKTAWREEKSGDQEGHFTMLPPLGAKTFTSEAALKLAHTLRKRADAILTGSGTVLADCPLFTVRNVPDHPAKSRYLAILDRRNRLSPEILSRYEKAGFSLIYAPSFQSALSQLGALGCLEVLVEAGPKLSQFILNKGFWNEHVLIRRTSDPVQETIEILKNVHGNYPKPR